MSSATKRYLCHSSLTRNRTRMPPSETTCARARMSRVASAASNSLRTMSHHSPSRKQMRQSCPHRVAIQSSIYRSRFRRQMMEAASCRAKLKEVKMPNQRTPVINNRLSATQRTSLRTREALMRSKAGRTYEFRSNACPTKRLSCKQAVVISRVRQRKPRDASLVMLQVNHRGFLSNLTKSLS